MSDFKIALGFDIKEDSREKIQKLIDSINAEKPKIYVTVNTTNAIKRVNTLIKQLNKLKDVKISISTRETTSNGGSPSEVTNAYYELMNLTKQMSKVKLKINGLDSRKNAQEIQELSQQLNNLKQKYDEVRNAFSKKFTVAQTDELDNALDSMNKLYDAKGSDKSNMQENVRVYKELLTIAREIDKTEFKIAGLDNGTNSNEIKVLTQQLNDLRLEYKNLYLASQGNLSSEQLAKLGNEAFQTSERIKQLNAKIQDTKIKLADEIGNKVDTNYRKELDTIATSMTKLSNVSTNLKSDFANLQTIWQDMGTAKASGDIEKLIDLNKEYSKVLSKVKTELKESQNAQRINIDNTNLQFGRQKLSSEIDIWLKKNSAGAKEFGATLKNIQAQIQTADGLKLKNLTNQFKEVDRQAELAGKKGLAFGDSIKQQFERITSYLTLYDVYSYTKRAFTSMFNEVKNVDTAMSGLYRVTDLTTSQYDEMYNGMTESAKKYGLVLSELIDGTTTWAKLGFDGQQASQLGEISARYQVVADTDAETAVTNLVTAYKAFQDELLNMYDGDSVKAVSYVSDVFNKIGNEFAIDAEQVGIGLTKGASALSVAGNTFQESVSM